MPVADGRWEASTPGVGGLLFLLEGIAFIGTKLCEIVLVFCEEQYSRKSQATTIGRQSGGGLGLRFCREQIEQRYRVQEWTAGKPSPVVACAKARQSA